jgi:hypothetical protein
MQKALNIQKMRVCATEHAPRNRFVVLERIHCLAEIVKRGAGFPVERLSIITPHHDRSLIILSENASRHAHRFAQHRLGFFKALQIDKGSDRRDDGAREWFT